MRLRTLLDAAIGHSQQPMAPVYNPPESTGSSTLLTREPALMGLA